MLYFRLSSRVAEVPQLRLFKSAQLQVHRPFRGGFPGCASCAFFSRVTNSESDFVTTWDLLSAFYPAGAQAYVLRKEG